MSLTDPIADMLTRIRNGLSRRHEKVDMPLSKMRVEIATVLKKEGYIKDHRVFKEEDFPVLRIMLKYTPEEESVIKKLRRVSRPSRRVYVGKDEIPMVLNGMGIAIISTSKGILTDADARSAGVGGELLCEVW
jgi:small subunit ribosomal protein S8